MLLGKLIAERDTLKDQVIDIKNYVDAAGVSDPNYKVLLDILYSCSFDYETCKNNIIMIANGLEVSLPDNKKTYLSNLMVLEKAIDERLDSITYLIRNKCMDNATFVSVIKQKKEYSVESIYIKSIINKVIWSTEIDNKGLGKV